MPTYEYECPTCGTYDVEQRITENALTLCPTCKGPTKRLISRSSFALKGSGWYSDGYGSSSGGTKKDAKAEGCGAVSGGCGAGACGNKIAQA
jgi:putative FmdB family regulatory protein